MRDDISVAVEVTSLMYKAKEFNSSYEDWTAPSAEYERLELLSQLNSLYLYDAREGIDYRVKQMMVATSEMLEDRYGKTDLATIIDRALQAV